MVWALLRKRILWAKTEGHEAALATLTSKALRLVIIFIFTVFPMVSTTIFQVGERTKCRVYENNVPWNFTGVNMTTPVLIITTDLPI
jgi:hypothetical protein